MGRKLVLRNNQQRRSRRYNLFKALAVILLTISIISTSYYSKSIQSSSALNLRAKNNGERCALLFFGLIKDSFQTLSLPSIQRNILQPNSHCDIFLHTYNLTDTPVNSRNVELTVHKLNISQVYLLTTHEKLVLEPMDSFERKRNEVLERTRKFSHRAWGKCCDSHDNMIKQWNSIQGVWDLMQQYEQKQLYGNHNYNINGDGDGSGSGSGDEHKIPKKMTSNYYHQVGLFRSDVYYTRPIHIFDSKAAIPNFAHYRGYNDRLFYGSYNNAKIWASQRFNFVNIFEEQYMKPYVYKSKDKNGYHSEAFVKSLMNHHRVRVELKDHCVWRVRNGEKIWAGDCDGMEGFSTFSDVKLYRPLRNESGDAWSLVVGY